MDRRISLVLVFALSVLPLFTVLQANFSSCCIVVQCQTTSDPPMINCVDNHGGSFAPGDVVPTHHPCRDCVCGAKGNILCESLNKVTECRPPSDAPCRNVNGTLCCERSFSCDRKSPQIFPRTARMRKWRSQLRKAFRNGTS